MLYKYGKKAYSIELNRQNWLKPEKMDIGCKSSLSVEFPDEPV